MPTFEALQVGLHLEPAIFDFGPASPAPILNSLTIMMSMSMDLKLQILVCAIGPLP